MRILLWIVGIVVALGAAGYLALTRVPAVQDAVFERTAAAMAGVNRDDLLVDDALRAFVCGSASPMPDPKRAKACIGVIAGGKIYFVDTGPQSAGKVLLWRIPFNRIGGVFYTHFHSDHIADLGEFNMNSWVLGREKPLDVYGPPGVERIVAGFSEAYTLDQTYRTAHHGAELANPEIWKMVAHPVVMPGEDPGEAQNRTQVVLDEGGLKVTAFEVHHNPIKPAYGYRFDYKGRSLVISGDTAKHLPLADAAKGADVLFHEAQAQHMVKRLQEITGAKNLSRMSKLMGDIQDYHTSGIEAAELANAAGVKLLVLYHFTPPVLNMVAESIFTRGISDVRPDGWLMSRDGTLVTLPIADKDAVNVGSVE
jgi:ribonuclease Z